MDSRRFTVLSLCAGVGGLDLGVRLAEPAARTVCFVEIEAYACAILAARMAENALDPAPVWINLRTFDGKPWRGTVDCITAGYPCQPFSVAGKQRGAEDPRHLWPDVFRVVREIRPAFCFFENVGGHLRLGFEQVHERLCGVVIECLNYKEFITRYDHKGALFYLDPPYYGNETDYGRGMFSRDEFAKMAELLIGIKGSFILSLNDRLEVRKIFSEFNIYGVETTYTVSGTDNSKKTKEVLISNKTLSLK